MKYPLSRIQRLALHQVWGEQCAWCQRYVFLSEMQVDHVVPKDLAGKPELLPLLTKYGLAPDFDLDALPNLVPSCSPVNRRKAAHPVGGAPVTIMLLDLAAEKAEKVQDKARRLETRRSVESALAVILEMNPGALSRAMRRLKEDEEQSSFVTPGLLRRAKRDSALVSKVRAAADVLDEALGETSTTQVHLHPALRNLHEPARWRVINTGSNGTAVVTDGVRGGRTGTHPSYQCPRCGSYGPWDGNRCVTCGMWDSGWD